MKTMQEVNKTSFGKYAPFDYDTYIKIKRIKSVMNLSRIEARRFDKWGAKRSYNRTYNKKLKSCDIFFYPVIKKYEIDGKEFDIQFSLFHYNLERYNNLMKYVESLWDYAKTLYDDPDDIPEFKLNPKWQEGKRIYYSTEYRFYASDDIPSSEKPATDIDSLYKICEKWHKEHVNENGAVI